ncbi:hypothetical protein CAOG_02303 [Capsaspora owczarzaki ATCC 30864]|uniref:Na+/H+ antiporter NhaC-like C-terminal domain-containing protein n=1 Tax=Capsaspora owczarzaki (strain ATCC 30864) TaxID=595528 RepID=A0A0D2X1N5_CAPO3|nr:hypothetical protein CAOG_02303 [Capsaspora owczarzaki ATCC 30864]KJE91119.1 hypothetical protein CAOG_002303 [Capsaspora owczarzaki ATCC 30864]|eukprot:XP_004349053.2 hypothetical protein CAOG_02303 [Capsaspora owczarzaki ATCC 30864]
MMTRTGGKKAHAGRQRRSRAWSSPVTMPAVALAVVVMMLACSQTMAVKGPSVRGGSPAAMLGATQTGSSETHGAATSVAAALAQALPTTTIHTGTNNCTGIRLDMPGVLLSGVAFSINVTLPPYLEGNQMWPIALPYLLVDVTQNEILDNGTFITMDASQSARIVLQFELDGIVVSGNGGKTLHLIVDQCAPVPVKRNTIPDWASLFPTILCIILAVALRQVLCALLLGTWLGAFFIESYNPLNATLRTVDHYILQTFVSTSHAGIILFTFQLGGLIGLVQKSGGALGLSRVFKRITTTPLRACLASFFLSLMIFFDDYSSILIVGSSLRTVLESLHVPREKFAFLVHSMGPALTSMSPVSSWIAVQLGYITSSFAGSHVSVDAFVMYLESIPYRAFPILMIVFVFLVIVTQRDFGPMLRARPHAQGLLLSDRGAEPLTEPVGGGRGRSYSSASYVPIEPHNPLSPKDSTPLRWFNAAIPFVAVIVLTFVGMYLSGLNTIDHMPASDRPPTTAENIFSNADSMDALIWSSLAGVMISLILVLVQCILNLSESLQAIICGVREVVEPTMILVLAWALGDVINQLQTGRYLSQLIGTGINPIYLPTIVVLVAYLMSYATGTSFGSMGILFPLVIPIVCELTTSDDLRTQTAAAIMGGCVFGNVASPIADNTILSTIATSCDLNAHIKTQTPYVLLVGAVSVLLCTLPVGMGAYPVYVGLPLATLVLLAILLVFGATDNESDSLFDRVVCTRLLGRSSKIRYRSVTALPDPMDEPSDPMPTRRRPWWSSLRFWQREPSSKPRSQGYEAIN